MTQMTLLTPCKWVIHNYQLY